MKKGFTEELRMKDMKEYILTLEDSIATTEEKYADMSKKYYELKDKYSTLHFCFKLLKKNNEELWKILEEYSLDVEVEEIISEEDTDL